MFEKAILGMSILRILSGMIEITVAILILKCNDIGKALVLNSSLALVGPLILISTTAIGLFGIAEKVSLYRIIVIFLGVILIIIGVKGK
ncbi:MAG: YqhV family protein [Tuberibacillus sp.]